MKSRIIKICFCSFFMTGLLLNADAQRTSKKKAGAPPTGQDQSQQNNVAKPPSGYNPYGNIPIEKDSSGGGYNDSVVQKSLRNTDAFDKNFVNERTPLPYEH